MDYFNTAFLMYTLLCYNYDYTITAFSENYSNNHLNVYFLKYINQYYTRKLKMCNENQINNCAYRVTNV